MATLVLSLAGAAVGAKLGGAVFGLSSMVIGRAVGATLGRLIDERLLGRGSAPVGSGRIERLRITGAGAGAALPRLWGRIRVAGHVIWAADFREIPGRVKRSKFGVPQEVEATTYTVSLAIALCEGEISGIGRIWADGTEIGPDAVTLRVYPGSEEQEPDPLIAAIEGIDNTPAYRGVAYVVIEELDLGRFGNRIPNFSFEVIRPAAAPGALTLQEAIRGVCWIPGTGEYSLSTEPAFLPVGTPLAGAVSTEKRPINRNSPGRASDFVRALTQLQAELPNVGSSLLVVSWFGTDLRVSECRVEPRVEFADREAAEQPWRVAGLSRALAREVPRLGGNPVYGGTPSDASVIAAIQALRAAGQHVVFYPFILMTQLPGNGLPDPWGRAEQPALPWRGRITTSIAPGEPGSPDGTAAAVAEVAAFFGTVTPLHFTIAEVEVSYSGPPDEWSYRRFILHYAALCKAAGGVDAFCIGSEMVGLTTIRGPDNSFPAVSELVRLLEDVRAILGPEVTLTYAADWTEYSGWQDGHGAKIFHLDPLWAHPDCDVIAIDNYMPLADWREGDDHQDKAAGSIYALEYLKANIAGGEGYDWFYASDEDRRTQTRTPITDEAEFEPWVWRVKDLRNFWDKLHYDRPGGIRAREPTAWVPRAKPIWFTEYGCAAIDKGANQPNKFLDLKSSESALPYFSNGRRDDLMQMQYLRAMAAFWTDPANNPVSEVYGGPMVDWSRAHVWCWDARPWPWFPGNRALWGDSDNWPRGHWITGRATNQPLAAVVAEICLSAGLAPEDFDVSGLEGVVRGYVTASTASPRAQLQPLLLAYGIEVFEREGRLVFSHRSARVAATLDPAALVAREGGPIDFVRAAEAETTGRVRLVHIDAEGSFETRAAEAVIPDEAAHHVTELELPLVLLPSEGRAAVRRWLAEARIARDVARFALPPQSALGPGDVVALLGPAAARLWRIDRITLAEAREAEAVRIEPGPYEPQVEPDDPPAPVSSSPPQRYLVAWLDLPLFAPDQKPHAPHIAASAHPWPGAAALWQAPLEGGEFSLCGLAERPAAIGVLIAPLVAARPWLWQRGAEMLLRMPPGVTLQRTGRAGVLAGANLLAVGNGVDWELLQFAEAELVAPGVWRLSDLLRGQFGTEAVIPPVWEEGSLAVLIDQALTELDLSPELRGQARRFRIGPAAVVLDDPAMVEFVKEMRGVGLRPYAPVHLAAKRAPSGAIHFRWIRRTRQGGDAWEAYEVPLAEDFERYRLEVRVAGELKRVVEVSEPEWVYDLAAQIADGAGAGFVLSVAQISAAWGPGPQAQLFVPG